MVNDSQTIARLQARVNVLEKKLEERSAMLQALLARDAGAVAFMTRGWDMASASAANDPFGLDRNEETTQFTRSDVIPVMLELWNYAHRTLLRRTHA